MTRDTLRVSISHQPMTFLVWSPATCPHSAPSRVMTSSLIRTLSTEKREGGTSRDSLVIFLYSDMSNLCTYAHSPFPLLLVIRTFMSPLFSFLRPVSVALFALHSPFIQLMNLPCPVQECAIHVFLTPIFLPSRSLILFIQHRFLVITWFDLCFPVLSLTDLIGF